MPIYKGSTQIASGDLYKESTVIQNVYKASDEVYTNVTMPTVETGQVGKGCGGSDVYGAGAACTPANEKYLVKVTDSGNGTGTCGVYLGTDPVYSNNSKHGLSWSFVSSDGVTQGGTGLVGAANFWSYASVCNPSGFPFTIYSNAWIINELGIEVVGSQTTVTVNAADCGGCPSC
mgnify:CR=1 FL=1